MNFLLFFLCFYCFAVEAHMPVFPGSTSASEPFLINDVTSKSWGIYGTLDSSSDAIAWLSMDGVKEEEMSVSLQRNEKAGFYDVAIWGPGLSSVNCTPDWYGWTHGVSGVFLTRDLSELPLSVKEAIGSEEAFVLHGDAKEDPEYEPFGVNLYWPIGGCKSTFPSSARYNMALVVLNGTIDYSLGVGMVESFSVVELITMSFVMLRTFIWGGRSLVSILLIFVLSTALSYGLLFLRLSGFYNAGYKALNGVSVGSHLVWLGASGLVGSATVWLSQLLWCYARKDDLGSSVWIAAVVHISLPLLIGILLLGFYRSSLNVLVFVAGVLMFFLAWQGYVVFPVLVMLGSFLNVI